MNGSRQTAGFNPDYVVPPGDTIGDLLEDREMTQTALARRLGMSLKHINQVINGGASLSPELALGLERVFSVPAGFWLNREARYQADVARNDEEPVLAKALTWAQRFPVKELKERGFVPQEAEGTELAASMLQFFGIASEAQWSEVAVSFRKSQRFTSDDYALDAWLRVGEIKAQEIECAPFDPNRFREALERARGLSRLSAKEWHPQLVEECAEAGVAVVIEEAFEKARANGATRWLSPTKAVIQLSLRGAWEDIFWFTFFHEGGHVLLHRKRDVFVEPKRRPSAAQADQDWLRHEREADRFAAKILIPPPFDARLRLLKVSQVPEFAERLGIAPAIVVGRLQHDGLLPYNQGNRLRRRFIFEAERS